MSFGKKEHSKYAEVAAMSEANYDYIVPSGNKFLIDEVGATPADDENLVELIWDATGTPEIILSTNKEASQRRSVELSGDGVKILRIRLVNNKLVSKTMGGYAQGGLNG